MSNKYVLIFCFLLISGLVSVRFVKKFGNGLQRDSSASKNYNSNSYDDDVSKDNESSLLSKDEELKQESIIQGSDDAQDIVEDSSSSHVSVKLKKGDSMQSILRGAGIDSKNAHFISTSVNKVYHLNRLAPGKQVFISYLKNIEDNIIREMKIEFDDSSVEVNYHNNLYKARVLPLLLQDQVVIMRGKVESSLYNTASKIQMHKKAFSALLELFSHSLDLQREVYHGSELNVVYSVSKDSNGRVHSVKDILYAQLKSQNNNIAIYKYDAPNSGGHKYFHEDGHSIKKPFLKTPIKGAVISSGFGRRMHPIHKYSRMHKGLDYAARINTPILAAADGVIRVMNRSCSYGNYIKIVHNNRYATLYAHMNKFARGKGPGSKVRQGEIIGFVGNTGHSTNPHLHYEVHYNGVQINPAKANKVKDEFILASKSMESFKSYVSSVKNAVNVKLADRSSISYEDFTKMIGKS
ncbi:M23 family metallopeptidase [Candidatus Cyrtobacter comes]|uniref:M23 family metallopeptidase n=1 Tax=Candidatus Cyrtobacter comes TaxID=675776 RepID=UPI002ACE7F11|nr:M23 family metallopeptidase [Candidatus Cyrtobacter comes]